MTCSNTSADYHLTADLFKLFEPLIGKKSIQYANGPEGRKRRQLMDRSFSHEAVKDYYEHFVRVAKETADNFAKCSPEEHIPLDKSMITMAVKAIAVAGMGRIFMDEKEIDKLATMYNEAWEEMEAQLTGPPPAADSEREKNFQKARAGLHGLVKDIIKRRQQDDEKAEKLFIDSILDCDFMDEEEICDDVISFLIGGFHTTGNMMTWCLYFLTKHPEVQEKVFDELDKVLGDEEDIKPQVVSELTYTRQVIDETLRAAVVAPWGARVYEYDLQVDEFVIPKETPILLPFGVVLQDPNLWPEPKRFDPDRFSPENIKQLPSLAYQPFGFAGKRKCPGWRFSIAEGLVFLSILIRRFKFHLVEGQEVKPVHRLVTAPAEEIWVTVTKR